MNDKKLSLHEMLREDPHGPDYKKMVEEHCQKIEKLMKLLSSNGDKMKLSSNGDKKILYQR